MRKAESELNTALPVVLMALLLLTAFMMLGPSKTPASPSNESPSSAETASRLLDSAVASARERKFEVATIQALAAARQLDKLGRSSEAPRALAADWLVRQGRHQEALVELELLAQIRPDYLPQLNSVRRTYDKQQRLEALALISKAGKVEGNEAVRLASQALQLFQKHEGSGQQLSQTHSLLGHAYLQAGNRRLAQHHLRSSGDSESHKLLARLEKPTVARVSAPKPAAPSYPTRDPNTVRVHGSPAAGPAPVPVAAAPPKVQRPKGGVVIGNRPKPRPALNLGRVDNLKSYHHSTPDRFGGY